MTADERACVIEAYRDFGNWARHYSTVRMTLATIFIPVSLGIMQFRWGNPDLASGLIILLMVLLGAILFMFFTKMTYQRAKEQIEAFNSLIENANPPLSRIDTKTFTPWRLDGYPAALIYLVIHGVIEAFWLWPLLKC